MFHVNGLTLLFQCVFEVGESLLVHELENCRVNHSFDIMNLGVVHLVVALVDVRVVVQDNT